MTAPNPPTTPPNQNPSTKTQTQNFSLNITPSSPNSTPPPTSISNSPPPTKTPTPPTAPNPPPPPSLSAIYPPSSNPSTNPTSTNPPPPPPTPTTQPPPSNHPPPTNNEPPPSVPVDTCSGGGILRGIVARVKRIPRVCCVMLVFVGVIIRGMKCFFIGRVRGGVVIVGMWRRGVWRDVVCFIGRGWRFRLVVVVVREGME